MKPAARPKATREEVMKIIEKSGFKSNDPVFLVGVRGYYRDTMGKAGVNDIGIYDDAMFLITPDACYSYNANTDPSKQRAGIACLVPGVHRYKLGKHGISKPGGGYPAFRPATPDESLPVTREGKPGIHKGIAINIHKGGYTTTSSEGCQTIWPDQWLEFYNKTTQAMGREGQKFIDYILVNNI